jgi:hypothetical protein
METENNNSHNDKSDDAIKPEIFNMVRIIREIPLSCTFRDLDYVSDNIREMVDQESDDIKLIFYHGFNDTNNPQSYTDTIIRDKIKHIIRPIDDVEKRMYVICLLLEVCQQTIFTWVKPENLIDLIAKLFPDDEADRITFTRLDKTNAISSICEDKIFRNKYEINNERATVIKLVINLIHKCHYQKDI